MSSYHYNTQGVCSRCIDFEVAEDGTVSDVRFMGGCNGNLQGIGRLVEGMDAQEVINRCQGIRCGMKSTSCPDQLAQALSQALKAED